MEQQADDIDRLTELEAAAALGSVEAQYEIACMVLEGRGVPRDVRFATAWFGCDFRKLRRREVACSASVLQWWQSVFRELLRPLGWQACVS